MAHLGLFGGVFLENADATPTNLAARRYPLALLALLATAPSRTLSRSKLTGLLWPDSPETKARNRLNTYIHQIRGELGPDALASVGEDVRLDEEALRCDVWDFERAIAAKDEAAAVALYRGPFLDGFELGGCAEFEHRVDLERSRLRRAYHDALEALAEASERAGDAAGAVRWWRERADDDPYDSRVARRLMEALADAGNPAEALHVAETHARRLETELGARPAADVADLAEALRSCDPGPAGPARPRTPAAPATHEPNRRSRPGEMPGPVPEAPRPPASPVQPSRGDPPARGAARPPRSTRRARARRMTAAILVVAALVAIGVALDRSLGPIGDGSSGVASPDRAIAVLPFERLAAESREAEESADALAEGLHSDLSTRLAGIPGLDVRPRTSVIRYRGDARPPAEIADELRVRWLLVAEVQRAGNELRLNARLLDAPAGRQVWTHAFRRRWSAGHLFDVQAEIAEAIAGALELRLSPENERRLRTVPTENTAAYELYLLARDLDRDPDAVGQADRKIELYHRALELDPEFAEAWAWIADAYVERAWAGEGLETWSDSALAAAGRALELNPDLADAYAQLGDVYWTLGRTEDAIVQYERALELQPGNPEAINNLLTLLERRGRLADKMKWAERTLRLAPTSPVPISVMASINAEIGRDEIAEAWIAAGRARGHDLRWTEFAFALHERGDIERASAILADLAREGEDYRIERRRAALALYAGDLVGARRHYRRLYPGVLRASAPVYHGLLWDPLGLAFVLDRLGDSAQAREIAREVVDATTRELSADPDHPPRHRLAVAHLILGDTTAALEWLEDAVDRGHRDVRLLQTVPTLEPLRDHPRFRALLERMNTLLAEQRRRIESEGWGVVNGGAETTDP